MPEIQSLTVRAQALSQSVDRWNAATIWALVFTALAAIAVLVTTAIALKQAKRLADVQRQLIQSKDIQLALDLKDRDLRIAEAGEQASTAETKAEGFRLDIAEANRRAADANRKAEEERLARIKIEEKLAGWRLEPKAQERLKEKLKPFSGIQFELAVNPSEHRFMETLDEILVGAGWQRQQPKGTILFGNKARINYSSGITVEFALDRRKDFEAPAAALVNGLIAEGIPTKGNVVRQGANPDFIEIFIGSR